MPENFANLHVLGITDENNPPGNVWHTMRSPTGWTPFTRVPLQPQDGRAVDVACVRRVAIPPETALPTEGLWALIACENSPPQLRFRNSDTSQWSGPVGTIPLPIARRVAVTVSPGVAPANDPVNPGGPRAYLHMAVVADGVTPQDQGRIIASIMPNRGSGGAPSAIAEVQTSGAGDLGGATAVALALASSISPSPDQESVASLAAVFPDPDGALFFTLGGVSASAASGRWAPFRARDRNPPRGPGGRPGEVWDVALAQGQASTMITDTNNYMAIARGGVDPDIYGATSYTTATGSYDWSSWENYEIFRAPFISVDTEPGFFYRLDISKTSEGLHVIGVTEKGQLLHQLRTPAAPGSVIFRDVELIGVGTEIGFFTAVACG